MIFDYGLASVPQKTLCYGQISTFRIIKCCFTARMKERRSMRRFRTSCKLCSLSILLIKDQKSNKCSICRLPVQSYLAAQLTSNLSVTELQQNSLAASISQTYLAITTIITPSNTIPSYYAGTGYVSNIQLTKHRREKCVYKTK